jgi:hypothetical protein
MERILIVDFASTQAWAKGVAPSANREGGGGRQIEAVVAKPLSASPPPTTDGVDMMYHQLVEFQAIAIVQLAECTRWHRYDVAVGMFGSGPVGRCPS